MANIANTIKVLEAAQGFHERHPGLMVGYAVGLTALAKVPVERYARLLRGHGLLVEFPGGEISKEELGAMATYYAAVDDDLKCLLGRGLDPDDPDTILKTIAALRLLVE